MNQVVSRRYQVICCSCFVVSPFHFNRHHVSVSHIHINGWKILENVNLLILRIPSKIECSMWLVTAEHENIRNVLHQKFRSRFHTFRKHLALEKICFWIHVDSFQWILNVHIHFFCGRTQFDWRVCFTLFFSHPWSFGHYSSQQTRNPDGRAKSEIRSKGETNAILSIELERMCHISPHPSFSLDLTSQTNSEKPMIVDLHH